MSNIIIIGSGFAGLSTACYLAKTGCNVTVFEKNSNPGGRARQFRINGFKFDMGPSWYWMPDVFENFFADFGKKRIDYYDLKRLDPSYRVYWKDHQMDVSANYQELKNKFEQLEKGSGRSLDKFLTEAAYKYHAGMNNLVLKPGLSLSEFLDWDILKGLVKLDIFTSIKKHISRLFKNSDLRQILEFPVLFLGALPENTPALYSLMNYADIKLGTWYPEGGIYSVVQSMYELAKELGVNFKFNHDVSSINIQEAQAVSITSLDLKAGSARKYMADVIIGAADYHFVETRLLQKTYQSYSEDYWNNRKMAPSCLLYYIGLNRKLSNVLHHSLFFDSSFERHSDDIYRNPSWPENPLFYVCNASRTDESIAPEGCENLFFLIPVASGLASDSENKRKEYFEKILSRFENLTGENIRNSIIYYRDYGPDEFVSDYNSFKGNAYGLANTLFQTAIFKPSCRSKKVRNLFYAGQLTVPGPGVPPALISGKVVSEEVKKYLKKITRK